MVHFTPINECNPEKKSLFNRSNNTPSSENKKISEGSTSEPISEDKTDTPRPSGGLLRALFFPRKRALKMTVEPPKSESGSLFSRSTVTEPQKEIDTDIDFSVLEKLDNELNYRNFDEKSKLIAEYFEYKAQLLEQKLETPNLPVEEIEDILSRKTAYEHISRNIIPNTDPFASRSHWKVEMLTGETAYMRNLEKELNEEIDLLKAKGILSMDDLKYSQLDAEAIMKRYHDKALKDQREEIIAILDPIKRLSVPFRDDPYLSPYKPTFYRIISVGELKNLLKTKDTGERINANGYYTDGEYSCITANPDYNEQMFGANGIPIRLQFKTMDNDGMYNMSLMNRIRVLKPERSIYRVSGYGYDDIDWNNVCVSDGENWVRLSPEYIATFAE